tara:strand:+ start:462 stop:1007 length:546 start_codon:yes stop_codon:yes gene_type:complete
MSKLVEVKKVIADGTSASVLLDGIDSNDIYYYTVTGATHDGSGLTDSVMFAHDGSSKVTTQYQGVSHGWRSDTTDSILNMSASANMWQYAFGWSALGTASTSITAPDQCHGDGYLFNFYNASLYSYMKGRFANSHNGSAVMLGGNTAAVNKHTAQHTGVMFEWTSGDNITGEFTLFKLLES